MKKINPEFLDQDFRSNRPSNLGVAINADITIQKHQLLLPLERIHNKHILDIGSFIGQTGDWCLNNGAASYTGIEISNEFANKSIELLSKYHKNNNWKIINQSLSEYFKLNNKKFDIVFCWGVLFGHHDHSWFIKELTKCGDHIVLESRHPKLIWNNNTNLISDNFWHNLEYNIPYAEWHAGEMTMLAATNGSIKCTAQNSSIKALSLLMELEGYTANLDVYEQLKIKFPSNFGMFREPNKIGRFVIEFFKDGNAHQHHLTENIFKNKNAWNINYIDWNKK